jgi:hypothetical protein
MSPNTFFAVGVLVVIGGVVGLSALAGMLRAWQRRQPDPAWKPAAPVQKYSGYDQDKAVAAKRRALELEKSKRRLAAMRSVPQSDTPSDGQKVFRIDKKRPAR